MTLLEMKKKVLGLIEELSPDNPLLTDDPDISTKFNDVTNIILYELARIKKIPKYVPMQVEKGDLIEFSDIEKECGYEIYQINRVSGVNYEPKAEGTVLKILESGTAELDVFVYPELITEKTNGSYEFELSPDALEIMPFGIAGDLLKSDVSTEYGSVYSARYEAMLNRLDPRYQMGNIYIDGGVSL